MIGFRLANRSQYTIDWGDITYSATINKPILHQSSRINVKDLWIKPLIKRAAKPKDQNSSL